MTPAQLIAANLAALPHPDGAPRQLSGFSTALLPDALREQVTRSAEDIGDAIVNLLELNGYQILAESDIPAPAGDTVAPPIAHLHCSLCDARLLSLNLVNPAHALTNGPLLIRGMSALSPECPHQ